MRRARDNETAYDLSMETLILSRNLDVEGTNGSCERNLKPTIGYLVQETVFQAVTRI